jgi:hypothetical protein
VAVCREFKQPFILGDIWTQYIEHVTSEWFARRSQSDADNQNRQIHGSFFSLQATSFGRELSLMELFVETHVQSQDRQKGVQQFVDNHAQHFIVCSFNYFIS